MSGSRARLRAATTADAVRGDRHQVGSDAAAAQPAAAGSSSPIARLLPDGYPRDDATAVAHLELIRAAGVTHLVFTWDVAWWLVLLRRLR